MLDKLKHLNIEERKQYVRDHPQEIVEAAERLAMPELTTLYGVNAHVIYNVLKDIYDGIEVPKV